MSRVGEICLLVQICSGFYWDKSPKFGPAPFMWSAHSHHCQHRCSPCSPALYVDTARGDNLINVGDRICQGNVKSVHFYTRQHFTAGGGSGCGISPLLEVWFASVRSGCAAVWKVVLTHSFQTFKPSWKQILAFLHEQTSLLLFRFLLVEGWHLSFFFIFFSLPAYVSAHLYICLSTGGEIFLLRKLKLEL